MVPISMLEDLDAVKEDPKPKRQRRNRWGQAACMPYEVTQRHGGENSLPLTGARSPSYAER